MAEIKVGAMNDKIKGLEEAIQTYINEHAGGEVTVEISRDIDFDSKPHQQKGMSWKVTVVHAPSQLSR
ncbi:hypothetical protein [Streptococcus pluranimalium]|uniref:hypothetical protein n=1 Tax=Streptococcus pluranimalium TaxID=82348 RepID=UPI004046CF41